MKVETRKDALEVLGLGPDATEEDIKAAYKRLAKQVHPDIAGSKALFQLINQAYELLTGGKPNASDAGDASKASTAKARKANVRDFKSMIYDEKFMMPWGQFLLALGGNPQKVTCGEDTVMITLFDIMQCHIRTQAPVELKLKMYSGWLDYVRDRPEVEIDRTIKIDNKTWDSKGFDTRVVINTSMENPKYYRLSLTPKDLFRSVRAEGRFVDGQMEKNVRHLGVYSPAFMTFDFTIFFNHRKAKA